MSSSIFIPNSSSIISLNLGNYVTSQQLSNAVNGISLMTGYTGVTAKLNSSIEPALMQSPGNKLISCTADQWNVVASMPASTSGILKTLWLATEYMGPDGSTIRIRWDQHSTADIGTDAV